MTGNATVGGKRSQTPLFATPHFTTMFRLDRRGWLSNICRFGRSIGSRGYDAMLNFPIDGLNLESSGGAHRLTIAAARGPTAAIPASASDLLFDAKWKLRQSRSSWSRALSYASPRPSYVSPG